ncbi:MAG: AbrB/MazE/SpoVT family DNA-binding domain-containing protein [candidate division NC10 bacterium]|nr:AbrB/MazE/SpoVT family DNA-binding domain-containing protein [candidate division NC10 bacterium]
MAIVRVSTKGQIVIPHEIRQKYHIQQKGWVEIVDLDGKILIVPLPYDPVRAARGMLQWKESTLEVVREMREEEQVLEDAKARRRTRHAKNT